MRFDQLPLSEPILRAIAEEGYTDATPIQARTIPAILEGRDVLGCAQTGTGKTAAFALPLLHRLSEASTATPTEPSKMKGGRGKGAPARPVRCLVLSPTRELALQISESFKGYGRNLGITGTTIYGGVNQNRQTNALRRGVDVVVATPGRLLDLMQQGLVDLGRVETLVLDEADRMLDMGFINDIRKILAQVPSPRQTLLFSATVPKSIQQLARQLLTDPVEVRVAPEAPTAERVEQSVYHVSSRNKPTLLSHLLQTTATQRTIVFTRTKHGADKLVKQLHRGGIDSRAIHGNKSQNQRARTLDTFKSGKVNVLIATDVASRGIDIDGVSHVINYDLTHEPECYVHRIGRTARAGAAGVAISFCARDEREHLQGIERLLRQELPVRDDHPAYEFEDNEIEAAPVKPKPPGGGRRGGRPQGRGQGGRGGPRSGKAGSGGGGGRPGRGRRRQAR